MRISRLPAPLSGRRTGDRATSSTPAQGGVNGSFTESSAYSPSVASEGRLTGSRHTAGRHPSFSASPPPDHFDDANLYTGTDASTIRENFGVVVRVRPPLPRELHGYRPYTDVVQLSTEHRNTVTLCDAMDTEDGRGAVYSRQTYAFDRVYAADASQATVYELSARPAVLSVLDGYNATLMAYGQTGTGKTYTMEGFTSEEERGIIPRAVEDVFTNIHERRSENPSTRFLVRASYMQIYNEVISDLLEPPPPSAAFTSTSVAGHRSSLAVRHTPQRGVYVDGLSEWVVRSPVDVYGLIAKGTAVRATSATKLSELSSRSHAIFTIIVEAMEGEEANPAAYRFGKLHIVDLAGSEKIRLAGVTGQRLEETKNINKSLHELGNVIAALATKSSGGGRQAHRHIPFRNSALTSALRDSLGGNCKTTLIACISPALESYAESLSTLMFANRAKNIQTHAVVNEGINQATLLRSYEQELRRLRQQLQERSETPAPGLDAADTHLLLTEMEADCRRAEKDRAAALAALRESSQVHKVEARAREALEDRIKELESILREGGMEGDPRTSQEYAERLQELEKERRAVAEDKEQVDRYKHLLLKQRDIMLSLTTRLNDRDETILLLQEEVDAYDQHVAELEAALEQSLRESCSTPSDSRQPTSLLVNPRTVGRLSESQAVQLIQQRCVPSSGSRSGSGPLRYRSFLQPSQMVTAEQLAIELVMLQGTGGDKDNTAVGKMDGLSEEVLTGAVQQRANSMLRDHYQEELGKLRQQVAQLTLQQCSSDDRAALADSSLAALVRRLREDPSVVPAVAAAGAALERAQREVQSDLQSRQAAYNATVTGLQEAARADRAERAQLDRAVGQLQMKMQHLTETLSGGANGNAALDQLWARLQEVEERVMASGAMARLISLASSSSPPPSTSSTVALQRTIDAQAERLRSLERELAAAANASPRGGTALTAMTEELERLRLKLAVHEKDRRALQTILEQRMRSKVDRLCEVLNSFGKVGGEAAKAAQEARSLQGLIHASIEAMDVEI